MLRRPLADRREAALHEGKKSDQPVGPDARETADKPADPADRGGASRSGHVQIIDRRNVWDTTGLEDTQQLMSFLNNPELALEEEPVAPGAGEAGNPYNSTGGKAFNWRKPDDSD